MHNFMELITTDGSYVTIIIVFRDMDKRRSIIKNQSYTLPLLNQVHSDYHIVNLIDY